MCTCEAARTVRRTGVRNRSCSRQLHTWIIKVPRASIILMAITARRSPTVLDTSTAFGLKESPTWAVETCITPSFNETSTDLYCGWEGCCSRTFSYFRRSVRVSRHNHAPEDHYLLAALTTSRTASRRPIKSPTRQCRWRPKTLES